MARSENSRGENDALRGEVDDMLAALDQQRRELADAQARLAETSVTVWSEDNLVKVVAGPNGVPSEVTIDPGAFKRATAESLSRSVTEAVQGAARAASAAADEAVAPLQAMAGSLPDLSDLVPGAPSIRDLISEVTAAAPVAEPTAPPAAEPRQMTPEEEDEYFRNRSYLQ